MSRKELLNLFRAAPWKNADEVDASLAEVGSAAPDDILKLLEVLTNRWTVGDAARQELRRRFFSRLAEPLHDRELFVPYVRALHAADTRTRQVLAALIPLTNSSQDHGEVCALLGSDEAELRQLGAQLLGRIGGKTAFVELTDSVARPGFPGRSEAMTVLAAIAGHHAIPAFDAVLSVGTPQEKIKALGHLASPTCLTRDPSRVLQAVARAFGDGSEAVQLEAIATFAAHASEAEYHEHVGPHLADLNPRVVRAAVLGLRHHATPRSVESLARALKTGPNLVRLAALEVLEGLDLPEALRPLVEALGHRQMSVRARAAEGLGRLARAGRIELARTVLWLLRSTHVNVRRMALEVAHSVPDPRGELWPKLLDYLYDEDWWVRERVIDTLVDVAGSRLVPQLFAHLRDDTDVVSRYFAVEVLRRLRAPEALGVLVHAANTDLDWLVRERAIEAIGALGDERAAPALVNLLLQTPDLRVACLDAIAAMGARSAAPSVALLLSNESLDVDGRLAVLRCLQKLDDPAQANLVRRQLRDPDPEARQLAKDLLTRWGALAAAGAEAVGSMLDRLLGAVASRDGDDLLLSSGRRPSMKRAGRTVPLAHNVFTEEQVKAFLVPHLSARHLDELAALRDVDFSYEMPAQGLRFRVNVFRQMGGLSAVFRIIRGALPDFESLGLPPVVASLADLRGGLVLVAGPTGSGKSTTLAALVDSINATSARHIVSLEDPIEVLHRRKRSLFAQREVGTHTHSFHHALRATLRQDPDVILVGEMRDYETIAFGVTAAETGHVVFGTIHTVSAAATIDRLINACPANQQDHMRKMLAGSLRGVVCQYLHNRRDAPGRCLSVEVMLNNDAVANLIRQGKNHQIPSMITLSRSLGMQTMDGELVRLVREGKISAEDAYVKAANKKEFEPLLDADPAQGAAGGRSA